MISDDSSSSTGWWAIMRRWGGMERRGVGRKGGIGMIVGGKEGAMEEEVVAEIPDESGNVARSGCRLGVRLLWLVGQAFICQK